MSQEIIDNILLTGVINRSAAHSLGSSDSYSINENVTALSRQHDDFKSASNIQVNETDVSSTNPAPCLLYGNNSGSKQVINCNASGAIKNIGHNPEGETIVSNTNDNVVVIGGRYETSARSLSDGTVGGLAISQKGYLHISSPKFRQQLLDSSTTGNDMDYTAAHYTSSINMNAFSTIVFYGNITTDHRNLIIQVSDDNATFYNSDQTLTTTPGGGNFYLEGEVSALYARLAIPAYGSSNVDIDCFVACM